MPAIRSLCALSLGAALLCGCVDVASLCAPANAMPEEDSDTIRGTVVNSVTREPVGRALVYSPDNRFATLTDSGGHFEFKVPVSESDRKSDGASIPADPATTFTTQVSRRPAYLMARKPGFLSNQNPSFTPLGPGQKEVTIYLVPGALITGHVTMAGSDNPERIQVEIYRRQIQNGRARWISAGTFRTWANEEFRFPELPAGSYKLFTHELMDRDPLTFDPRGQLYGYPPVFFPGVNEFSAASTIQLSPGLTVDAELSLTRREYYPVEISIANAPEGAPVGVEVSAGGQSGPGYSLGYNPQLQKVQGFLPDGTYTVEVSSSGPSSATGVVDIGVNGATASGYSVNLAPNPSISVNVAEDFTSAEGSADGAQSGSFNGNQLRRGRDLQIRLESAEEFGWSPGYSPSQHSGSEGESLIFEGVKPGRYWVHAESTHGFAASINCGQTELLHHPLVVAAGGSSDPIDLKLQDDGAEVDGIIEDIPTAPGSSFIPAAHIYLIPLHDSTGQFRELWASPDGHFSLGQIPPGDYQVLAFDRPQPELEYNNEEAMRKYHAQERVIRLVAGQREQLRLRMILGND